MLAKGQDKMRIEENAIFPTYNMLPTRDFQLFFPCVLPGSLFFFFLYACLQANSLVY